MSQSSPLLLLFCLLLISSAVSWNLGGGGEGEEKTGSSSGRHGENYEQMRDLELDELLSRGSEQCAQKPCVQSEQCCPGSVCVDANLAGKRSVAGTCLPIYGVNEGNSCTEDDDCEPGLRCLANGPVVGVVGNGGGEEISAVGGSRGGLRIKSCQPPGLEMMKKKYNDECSHSSECDASRGLCCQLIRRHRMSPRQACLYFTTPAVCIGQVDVSFARPMAHSSIPYTPAEHDFFRARIG